MELQQVIRARRMVRNFDPRPVPAEVLDRVLANAVRAPSAGFAQGWAFVVLQGPQETAPFWELTTTPEWRARRPRRAGVQAAPIVILPLAHEQAYLDRYAEPDKAGLGMETAEGWPVPYWLIDTAFATLLMLLTAVDAGLGALFFGIFQGERELLEHLGVPPGYRPIGAVALGYPAAPDPLSLSLARGRRELDEVVHRGRWDRPAHPQEPA
ncbi:MAG TPA: nitroreductase family protein [Acidimicrobiales bacterium]|nr:nitroreductase family protein [Acidimicrobiales bacterium]